MTYKTRVYETLRIMYNNRFLYVSTNAIVERMGQGYYRTYRALRALEADGIVQRKSPHSGWRPTLMASGVYNVLLRTYRRSHDYIPTRTIAIQLNTNDRIIRDELYKLEQAGIIERLASRGGWKPARHTPPTAREQLLATLRDLHHSAPVPTRAIADTLGIHPAYCRKLLNHYVMSGRAERAGYFAGWLPASA
ncbi:MAG: hypothetical protein ACFE0Q_20865 [Anaerolineae bacterium]